MHTLTTPTETRTARARRTSRSTASRSRRAWGGNLTATQDAKGNQLQYTYDAAGRRTEEKHIPAGTQSASRSITYTYNPAGSLTGYTDNNSTPGAVAHSASYTLDALQRKTQEVITVGSNSHTILTTWTPTGQKASQTTPGGLKADYSYDSNQQLAGVSLPVGQLSISERQWNAPRKITFPGGSTQSRDYDPLLRPTRIKLNDPGQATKLDYAYTYDAESNITKKATEHGSYDYAYDDLYRLTTVGNPSGLANEAFTYDKLGNRLTDKTRGGSLFGNAAPWEYNGNNQLLKSYTTNGDPVTHTYDENGSLTKKQSPGSEPTDNQQFIYDAANRLSEVKDKDGNSVATYQYDPFGRRIAKTAGGNTTFFLYSDEGLIAEATPTGSIATEYGWQPGGIWGTDPLFIKTTKTNGQSPEVFYYQNDHLGTPQKVIDAQGSIVWEAKALAFGETTVAPGSTIANSLRFPGQYEDPETKTHQNYFRDFDPLRGMYVKADPIGLRGGINYYGYANSNAANYIDPRGLQVDINWFGVGDSLHQSAKNVPQIPSVLQLAGHGTPTGIENGTLPTKPLQSCIQIANAVMSHPNFKTATSIRLLSCNTGRAPGIWGENPDESVAQCVARRTGKPVEAPNDLLWFLPPSGIPLGVASPVAGGDWWAPYTQEQLDSGMSPPDPAKKFYFFPSAPVNIP